MTKKNITREDLLTFRSELMEDIEKLLNKHSNITWKKYLKSAEVMDLLKISAGTIQHLRINGTLPYVKIGGTLYYDSDDIRKVMEGSREQFNLKP